MDFLKSKYFIFFKLILYIHLSGCQADTDSTLKNVIKIKVLGEILYVYEYNWGVSGNHSDIVISNREIKNKNINEDFDYYFKGNSIMFYKTTKDTLHLFVETKVKIPPKMTSKIIIVQHEKTNAELYSLRNSYQGQGIKKIGK